MEGMFKSHTSEDVLACIDTRKLLAMDILRYMKSARPYDAKVTLSDTYWRSLCGNGKVSSDDTLVVSNVFSDINLGRTPLSKSASVA